MFVTNVSHVNGRTPEFVLSLWLYLLEIGLTVWQYFRVCTQPMALFAGDRINRMGVLKSLYSAYGSICWR